MKITVINGVSHKGSTYNIGKMLLDNITCDKHITEFFLPDDLNHFCKGCYACTNDESKCPFFEDKMRIMKACEEADLLVFTTPTYCLAQSAPLKAFFDLTFTYWFAHKPRGCMFSKKAVVIATSAGASTKSTTKPVKTNLMWWGVPCVETYGARVAARCWNEVSEKTKQRISTDIKKLAAKLSKEKKPAVNIKVRLNFCMLRLMHKASMDTPQEHSYWEKQGWLGKERPWKIKQAQKKELYTNL